MKVLLSVKPEFANKIFEGVKRFEFRRTIFKEKVNTVLVYASSPTKKVIGEFEIDEIINDSLDNLWRRTKKYAGIGKEYFYTYFADKEHGYAIKIKKITKYNRPLCIKKDLKLTPPQSFVYVSNDESSGGEGDRKETLEFA